MFVGTPKRERQKVNRQQRLEELARQARTEKRKRTGMYVLLIPIAALAIAGVAWLVKRGDDGVASAPSTTVDPFAVASSTVAPTTVAPAPFAYGIGECPAADGTSPKTQTFAQAPKQCIDPTKTYTATVTTNKGAYTAVLDAAKAPGTVNNFVALARYHYFDGISCHRAIPGFMVQCGDPEGTGSGGPGYEFGDELPSAGQYQIGSLAMANSGPNTNGSQFFLITGDQGVALPPSYSLFGQVTDGLDTTVKSLDAAGNPDQAANGVPPKEPLTIESVSITES